MKNVLLTTTALVAFAGAAAAEVSLTWGGSASVEYNVTDSYANITLGYSTEVATEVIVDNLIYYDVVTTTVTDTSGTIISGPTTVTTVSTTATATSPPTSVYTTTALVPNNLAGTFTIGADLGVSVSASTTLNNGMVASLTTGSVISYDGSNWTLGADGFVAMLETSYGSISFGDIDNVNDGANNSFVAGMAVLGKSATDGYYDVNFGADSHDLRAETSIAGFNIAASMNIEGTPWASGLYTGGFLVLEGSLAGVNVTGSVGTVDVAAYFENVTNTYLNDYNGDGFLQQGRDSYHTYYGSSIGFTASTELLGVDVTVAYASRTSDQIQGWRIDGSIAGQITALYETKTMGIGLSYAVSDAITVSASAARNTYSPAVFVQIAGLNNNVLVTVPYTILSNSNQIAVGVAYDDGSISASLDYDVDAASWDAAAGYTAEISAGTTVTVGATFNSENVSYGSIDLVHVSGDMSVYAGADTDSNTYAGVDYDLGGGASAYAYYSGSTVGGDTNLGPLDWDTGTVIGIALTF